MSRPKHTQSDNSKTPDATLSIYYNIISLYEKSVYNNSITFLLKNYIDKDTSINRLARQIKVFIFPSNISFCIIEIKQFFS